MIDCLGFGRNVERAEYIKEMTKTHMSKCRKNEIPQVEVDCTTLLNFGESGGVKGAYNDAVKEGGFAPADAKDSEKFPNAGCGGGGYLSLGGGDNVRTRF